MNEESTVVNSDKYMRYFIYSNEQSKLCVMIQNKLGRAYKPGTVIVNGQQRQFTEMLKDLSDCRYSDAETIAYGDIREMNYTMPAE